MHHPARLEITIAPLPSVASLGERWRALEANADGGFFRSWAFIQCQAARCRNPSVLAVREHEEDVALALLNRRRGVFHVGETGDPALDSVFVEHGGLLLRRGGGHVLPAALGALCAERPVVLGGVDDAHLQAARQAGLMIPGIERFAPCVDLRALQGSFLANLSANARAQIGRAMRLYGPGLTLRPAPDAFTALAWFNRLVALHQARWHASGQPGAFADADVRGFHETLIRAAHGLGQLDLLRISAGETEIGYLYIMKQGGSVFSYQSGFAPAPNPQLKPGLVSHALAIEHYRAAGLHVYDLLGGAQRYKTTLAPQAGTTLHWITLFAAGSLRGRAQQAATRLKQSLRRAIGAVRPPSGVQRNDATIASSLP
jgi:CelD/BcsL family acetyltransferase involved in cellulose biosynthesis